MNELEENVWVPTDELSIEAYQGFEFDQINKDLFGNNRSESNSIGAVNGTGAQKPNVMDLSKYGTDWYDSGAVGAQRKPLLASSVDELINAIEEAQDGDTIELTADRLEIDNPIKIDKKLTIKSAKTDAKTAIAYSGPAETPAFEMNPQGQLTLNSIRLSGNGKNYAFASLKENMSSLYNLTVKNCEISDFDYVLKAYKHSFAEHMKFISTRIENCNNGIELSAEDDDRGDYNAENVYILDCQFDIVNKNVIDYYRGGYDESTVGGTLVVKGSEFTNSGAGEANGILINTYGIINVEISENKFQNNKVKLVARLWGAKNNSATENSIENSGQIMTEQNLPLKLMY